jgi:hypothetical protein
MELEEDDYPVDRIVKEIDGCLWRAAIFIAAAIIISVMTIVAAWPSPPPLPQAECQWPA